MLYKLPFLVPALIKSVTILSNKNIAINEMNTLRYQFVV